MICEHEMQGFEQVIGHPLTRHMMHMFFVQSIALMLNFYDTNIVRPEGTGLKQQ